MWSRVVVLKMYMEHLPKNVSDETVDYYYLFWLVRLYIYRRKYNFVHWCNVFCIQDILSKTRPIWIYFRSLVKGSIWSQLNLLKIWKRSWRLVTKTPDFVSLGMVGFIFIWLLLYYVLLKLWLFNTITTRMFRKGLKSNLI